LYLLHHRRLANLVAWCRHYHPHRHPHRHPRRQFQRRGLSGRYRRSQPTAPQLRNSVSPRRSSSWSRVYIRSAGTKLTPR